VIFFIQNTLFLTLELIISILSIGSCFSEKNWFVVADTTKCCKPFFLCDIPLVRGDCVDIPLSEEVIGLVALCFILKCEVIVVV